LGGDGVPGVLAFLNGLVHFIRAGNARTEQVDAAEEQAVGKAKEHAERDADNEARPIARKIRPRKADRPQEGIHG
jgi:hypothetical protein